MRVDFLVARRYHPNLALITSRRWTAQLNRMDDQTRALISAFAGVLAIGVIWPGRRTLMGTTLLAAWCWAVVAIGGITSVEVALAYCGGIDRSRSEAIRFVAAILALCPAMALLGAKRPQNAAWQFVVLSLIGVLALPAVEVLLRGRGEEVSLDPVRSWFLLVLVGAGAVNHLPTRFAASATLFTAAQVLLFWQHLPWGDLYSWRPPVWLGLALALLSAFWLRFASAWPSAQAKSNTALALAEWNHVWREFRDWYGVVWSARVTERMNSTAASFDWPVTLLWEGFAIGPDSPSTAAEVESVPPPPIADGTNSPAQSPLAPDQHAMIEQSFRALLRRFVSAEWIDTLLKNRA